MRRTKSAVVLVAVALLLGIPAAALAVPTLQLDILDGTYDEVTEDILAPGDVFTLVAVLTPNGSADVEALLADTYFISAALMPETNVGGDFGSFDIGDTTVDATGGMTLGVPPLDDAFVGKDPGDLPQHGVFETFFYEQGFHFNDSDTTDIYNTADDPGGLSVEGSGAYYATFDIDISTLAEGADLHFDLYSSELARPRGRQALLALSSEGQDYDVGIFAPFSHDAGTHRNGAPEPGTLLLLGAGMLLLGATRRRR